MIYAKEGTICSEKDKATKVEQRALYEDKESMSNMFVESIKTPSQYSDMSIMKICREINNVLDVYRGDIDFIYNVLYRSLAKGGVFRISSKNQVDLINDIAANIFNTIPAIDKDTILEIVQEWMYYLGTGLFSNSEGFVTLYSHLANESGVFGEQNSAFIFTLETPIKILDEEVSAIFLICAPSEHVMHFCALKVSGVLKLAGKDIISNLKDKKDNNVMCCIVDHERNVDIFRKLCVSNTKTLAINESFD
ncbi:MAG: hypothetical protein KAH32_02130 [Chlamydiia bacterium]|nr:hypothetical protein [Chlamydiia bacterium]